MKLLTHLIGLCALLLSGSALVSAYVPEVPKECVIILYGTHNWLMINIGEFRMQRPVYQQIRDNGDFGTGTLTVTDTEFRWYMHANGVLAGTSHALKDSDSSCPAALLPLYDMGVATHWIFDARPESMCVPQRQYINTAGGLVWYKGKSFDDCMHRAAIDYPDSRVAQWKPSTTECEIKGGSITSTISVGTSAFRGCVRHTPVRVPGIGEPRQGYRSESVFGVCHTRMGYAFHYSDNKELGSFPTWEECAVLVAEQYPDYLVAQFDKTTHKCLARRGTLQSEGLYSPVISCQMKVCDGNATMFEGGTFEVMHPTDNFADCSKLVSGMRIDAVGAQWGTGGTKECRAIFGSTKQVASTSWQSCPLNFCKQEGLWYKAPAVKPDGVEPRVKIDAPPGLSFEECAKYVGQAYPWASVIDMNAAGECTAYFGQEFTTGVDDSHTSCKTSLVRRRGPLKYEDRAWKEYDYGTTSDIETCINNVSQVHREVMGVSFNSQSKKCVAVPLMAYVDATSYETRTYWMSAFLKTKPMGTTTSTATV